MQKNKFIHEDIWTVCNRATKKLVAIGLVAAVGGACTIGCDTRLLASAQSESPASEQGESPASTQGGSPASELKEDFHHTVSDNGNTNVAGDGLTEVTGNGRTLVAGDGDTVVTGNGSTLVVGHDLTAVIGNGPTRVAGNGYTRVSGNGTTLVMGNGLIAVYRPDGKVQLGCEILLVAPPELLNPNRRPDEAAAYVPRDVFLNEVRTATINGAAQVDINCPCDVTHDGSGGQLTVTGGATIAAEGTNTVTVGRRSTVYSSSSNLFTHDGTGAGIIDGGDIEFSGFTEDRPTRNVTVQAANSVTVASGLTTGTLNGEGFPMGETLQETAENILRALSPNSRQEILSKFGSSSGGK